MRAGLGIEAVVVALLTGVIIPLLLPVLRHVAMDRPNERSSHVVPVPRGGGLALLASVMVAAWWWPWPSGLLALALLAVAVIGLLDDVFGLHQVLRLVAVTVVGLAVGVRMLSSSPTSPESSVSRIALLATVVLFLVGFTNAFNFMDGINGISGLNALVIGASLAILSAPHSTAVTAMAVALAAAASGFLPWNVLEARVFLGDVGSYLLGFGLSACGFAAWRAGLPLSLAIAPFGIYLVDTGLVIVRRAIGRRPLLTAHREHVYQRLVDSGIEQTAVALGVAAFSAVLVLFAVLARQELIAGSVGVTLAVSLYIALPRIASMKLRASR